jgi:hypothetical protein
LCSALTVINEVLAMVKMMNQETSAAVSESESGYLSHQRSMIMAIPSGEYIIENAHNINWAILRNANDYEDVRAGTDADESAGHKVINQLVIFISMEYRDTFPSTVVHQKTLQRNILSS